MEERSKRERILGAAQVVFARNGYFQAKMEEIAELAEVGKGTIYEYFSSKQDLYKEMFRMILGQYTGQVVAINADQLTVEARVRYLIEMHLRYMMDNRQHTPNNFGDLGGMDEELLGWMYDMRKESIVRLIGMLSEGIAREELKGFDPELGANLLAGILRGITIPIMMDQADCEPEKVAAEVTDILFHGMAR
jgi:TetR/AcrR family fatty acid metabolism transcriptional regulator